MHIISQNYSFEAIDLKLSIQLALMSSFQVLQSVFVETDLSLSKQNEIYQHFNQKLIKEIKCSISQNYSFEAIDLKLSIQLAFMSSFQVLQSVFVETDLSLSKQNEIYQNFNQKLIKIKCSIYQNYSFEAIEMKLSTQLAYKSSFQVLQSVSVETDLLFSKQNENCLNVYKKLIKNNVQYFSKLQF